MLTALVAVPASAAYQIKVSIPGLEMKKQTPAVKSFSAYDGSGEGYSWVYHWNSNNNPSTCDVVDSQSTGSVRALKNYTCAFKLSRSGFPQPAINTSNMDSLDVQFEIRMADYQTNYAGYFYVDNVVQWRWDRGAFGQLYGKTSLDVIDGSGERNVVLETSTTAKAWTDYRINYQKGVGLTVYRGGSVVYSDPNYQPKPGMDVSIRAVAGSNQVDVRDVSVQWTEGGQK